MNRTESGASSVRAEASEYEYNNLAQIEGVRHEVILDKSVIHHDTLFKIIIIGDTGKTIERKTNLT